MKLLLTPCLMVFLPTLVFAQATAPVEAPPKPAVFAPVTAKDHEGLGLIGVRLTFDKAAGLPQISAILRGSPAADFGLCVGDFIIRVDKNLTTALTEDEVHLALRGQPGTGVELTIQRGDNPHLIIRALERRVLFADSEEMIQPPLSEESKLPDVTTVPVTTP